ncbi:MAG: YceI family protein [Bacteroidota bacterium]|nr:YceI family protein [Bacteroidota bacterium]
MKSFALTFAAIFVLATSVFAQNKYTLDKYHSRLAFSVKHMGISSVDGNFKSFDVTVTSSKADLTDAKVEMVAQVNSINTEIDKRDQHLQSPDFFDAAKYPTLTFKSTSFKKVKGNVYKLSGFLTMKGVTKPIAFTVVHAAVKSPMDNKIHHGFAITGTLNRQDYNVGTSAFAAVVGNQVKLSAEVDFAQE